MNVKILRTRLIIIFPAILLLCCGTYLVEMMGVPHAPQAVLEHHRQTHTTGTQPLTVEHPTQANMVLLSDTHGLHLRPDKLNVPPGDMLICAGDIEIRHRRDWAYLMEFLRPLPHKHKVVSFGNMDRWTEDLSDHATEFVMAAKENVTIVRDEVKVVGGWRVLASPWTPRFYGAYQLMDEEQAREHWTRVLPNHMDLDILVTHGPPYGFGDKTCGRSVGDKALLEAVQSLHKPPKLWVVGHIHDGRGQYTVPHRNGDILLINAAVAHLQNNNPEVQPFIVGLRADQFPTVSVGKPPEPKPHTAEVWKASIADRFG